VLCPSANNHSHIQSVCCIQLHSEKRLNNRNLSRARMIQVASYFSWCLCIVGGSRDSDWLRAGRRSDRSSSPSKVKNFSSSMSSRPVLGPTQPPIQWVPGAVSLGVKRLEREADHSPTSAEVKKTYIRSAIRLHDVVLN
jgi:hypothetical protein